MYEIIITKDCIAFSVLKLEGHLACKNLFQLAKRFSVGDPVQVAVTWEEDTRLNKTDCVYSTKDCVDGRPHDV